LTKVRGTASMTSAIDGASLCRFMRIFMPMHFDSQGSSPPLGWAYRHRLPESLLAAYLHVQSILIVSTVSAANAFPLGGNPHVPSPGRSAILTT